MNAFIEKIKDGAIAAQKKYGVLASLTIAQAILETGWGKCSVGNNIFGIKASPSWTGGTVQAGTSEYINGQYVGVSAAFRTYASIEDSIADHALLFVNNDCYHNILGCTDYRQACRNVQTDGYATCPTYADKLIEIIEENDLTQFDAEAESQLVSESVPAQGEQTGPNPTTVWDYKYDSMIADLQQILNAKGHSLAVDGKAGDQTYNAVKNYTINNGDSGPLTKWVQQRLTSVGCPCGAIDGIAGDKTMAAIQSFQGYYQLGTGYLGGADWYYMIR